MYLDHAATSPVCQEAADAVLRGLSITGNPSSRHAAGDAAAEALEGARGQLALMLGCPADDVVFTSGGSEADALAVCGTVLAAGPARSHIVTTAIEHSAVLEACRLARELGAEITVVRPDPSGRIDPEDIRRALRPRTVLVSVMHANNETGVIQPVSEIAALARSAGALMHTDAVQTAGKLDLATTGADLISVSAHKFYGPKGVGALKVAAGVRMAPLIRGGSQERGLRAGTENLPGVMGMAAAAAVALRHMGDPDSRSRMRSLRTRLTDELTSIPGARVNGDGAPCLPETLNISFDGVRGDTLVDVLAAHGVCVSAGSACHSESDEPSHVLTAMGIPPERARSSVRFSPGRTTTAESVTRAARDTATVVSRLRLLGPAPTLRPTAARET
ncbi:cysteine desulfurase family protein [Streptomyces sodiiphilus]|uniref:cysteine desulfurase family protein n=1 Tax=Streptomyces sodiiphilus TaxID=226217 RepID=UPI0031DD4349